MSSKKASQKRTATDEGRRYAARPLIEWLDSKGRGAKSKFARDINISPARLTNWLRRGVPEGQLYVVADKMGMSYERYRRLIGTLPPLSSSDSIAFTEKLIDDIRHLPPGLREYVARQAADLRQIVENTTKEMSHIFRPPVGESYKKWEEYIVNLLADHRAKIEDDAK